MTCWGRKGGLAWLAHWPTTRSRLSQSSVDRHRGDNVHVRALHFFTKYSHISFDFTVLHEWFERICERQTLWQQQSVLFYIQKEGSSVMTPKVEWLLSSSINKKKSKIPICLPPSHWKKGNCCLPRGFEEGGSSDIFHRYFFSSAPPGGNMKIHCSDQSEKNFFLFCISWRESLLIVSWPVWNDF